MKRTTTYAAILIAFALRAAPAMPQQENACADKAYENHNHIDYKPLKLAKIQGRGVIEIRDNVIKPNETVPGACLSLFTLDEKFVMSARADSNGGFRFDDDVAPGRYRLVARAPGFCTANIPIQVVKASRKSKLQSKEVVVHYRVTGIDTCSWGALEEKSATRNP
jgi:Carboxypeptidase regulatory-like domain